MGGTITDLTLKPDVETTFTEIDKASGDVVTTCMISGDEVARISKGERHLKKYQYSLEISNAIVMLLRRGNTLKKIASMEGMPDISHIYMWRNMNPDFREKCVLAQQDHADYLVDTMIDEANDLADEDSPDPDKIKAHKEKAATTKWVAEKRHPEQYGNKTKIDQTISGNAGMFVVQTGINREPIEAEVVEVTEVE